MLSKPFRFQLFVAVLLLAPVATLAQAGKPAVDYRSLLNIGFAEADGDLELDALNVILPPPGYEQAMLTISKASGEEVGVVPLRLESYLSFPVFGRFVPESKPTALKLGQPGDFVLTIKIADEVITRFPFSLVSEPDHDPYAKPKGFFREGPWRDFAYFSLPLNDAAAAIKFNWWMSLRELPPGVTNPSVSIHLVENYKEIARSREPFRLDNLDWQFFTSDLLITKSPGTRQLTLRELVQRDTTYLLIVKANDQPIKSYRVEVKSGRLQHADQSRIDFEPHADFISPRFLESKADSNSDYFVTDAYWVRRSGVRRSFPATWNQANADQNARISKKE